MRNVPIYRLNSEGKQIPPSRQDEILNLPLLTRYLRKSPPIFRSITPRCKYRINQKNHIRPRTRVLTYENRKIKSSLKNFVHFAQTSKQSLSISLVFFSWSKHTTNTLNTAVVPSATGDYCSFVLKNIVVYNGKFSPTRKINKTYETITT